MAQASGLCLKNQDEKVDKYFSVQPIRISLAGFQNPLRTNDIHSCYKRKSDANFLAMLYEKAESSGD